MVLVAWYVLGTLWVYPYSLAYFNELVGGAANGYRHVVDSNVDWGHSFKALAWYMQREEIAEVRLSYWTWVDPAWYGVRYTPLPPASHPRLKVNPRTTVEESQSSMRNTRLRLPASMTAQPGRQVRLVSKTPSFMRISCS